MYSSVIFDGLTFTTFDPLSQIKVYSEEVVHHIAVNTDHFTHFAFHYQGDPRIVSRREFFRGVRQPFKLKEVPAPQYLLNMMNIFEPALCDALWVRAHIEPSQVQVKGPIDVPCYECHQNVIDFFNRGNYVPVKSVTLRKVRLAGGGVITSYRVGRCSCGVVLFIL